jgi:hypothetical protein
MQQDLEREQAEAERRQTAAMKASLPARPRTPLAAPPVDDEP